MKIRLSLPIILSAFVLLVVSCDKKQAGAFKQVQAGQTKADVKRILGEPYEVLTITKTKGPIWGPEEEFWDKIPNGTVLEMWRYQNATGNLNLYFKEGDKRLDYRAFAPQGAVYEAEH